MSNALYAWLIYLEVRCDKFPPRIMMCNTYVIFYCSNSWNVCCFYTFIFLFYVHQVLVYSRHVWSDDNSKPLIHVCLSGFSTFLGVLHVYRIVIDPLWWWFMFYCRISVHFQLDRFKRLFYIIVAYKLILMEHIFLSMLYGDAVSSQSVWMRVTSQTVMNIGADFKR